MISKFKNMRKRTKIIISLLIAFLILFVFDFKTKKISDKIIKPATDFTKDIFQAQPTEEDRDITGKNDSDASDDISDESTVQEITWKNYCDSKISTEKFVNSLSIKQIAQQLLAPGFTHDQIKYYTENNIEPTGYGFYVFLSTKKYTNAQSIKNDSEKFSLNNSIPTFIGLDAEADPIKRLSWHDFFELSDLINQDEENICQSLQNDIKTLKDSGFNWSLAPVVDLPLNSNDWIYDRTISTNKDEVVKVAGSYLKCLQNEKILTTLKHFPGHGETVTDSHKNIPVVTNSEAEWESRQGSIYSSLLNRETSTENRPQKNSSFFSNNDIISIMMGHLQYPNIDDSTASSSSFWMRDILREKLHYNGIIITDDLAMLTPTDSTDCFNKIWISLDKGADVALFSHYSKCDHSSVLSAFESKLSSLNENDLSIFKEKVSRVVEAKRTLLCD